MKGSVRLLRVRVVRNVEGEVVLTVESPTIRVTGFLAPDEARDLFRQLGAALQQGGTR